MLMVFSPPGMQTTLCNVGVLSTSKIPRGCLSSLNVGLLEVSVPTLRFPPF